ncbi:RHS repeat domain-containing protein [Pseudomonas kilonensis]|uniref:Insecticidal toxin complex protein TccC n=1 Tax=Pseudomonas kilonensis TaxID=132476 RepID=A0ABY0YZY6_9PSED|nr:RHS repeat-associated core domain-containing protein [Pseudomonas kilonensis]SEE14473.1 insecticidal toxin complex protein TccC [Pseudomonas kilonensis]
MSARLHSKTPTLNAVDGRGLPVRRVAYCRDKEGENAQTRVSRQEYDVAGRLIAQRDPRFANATDANLATMYSLSGKPLQVNSIDAGWRVNLPGDAGQVLRSWDQRENHWQSTYDNQLRLTTVKEQAGKKLRTVEYRSYGDSSPESKKLNRCGALIRHDDSAGTLIIEKYALCGKPHSLIRHFLSKTEQPDWPTDEKERDGLREEGQGFKTSWTYDALGQIIQQTDATQHEQHYTFDVAGQLKSVNLKIKDDTAPKIIVKDLVYNAFGHVESQTAGNGVTSRAVFDPASGRLTSLSASAPGKTLQDLHYTYDAVGNVLQITDNVQPERFNSNQRVKPVSTFTYDSLHQLTSATGREAAGLTAPPGLPGTGTISFDPTQLFNFAEQYTYDDGGNLTELRHLRDGNNYTRTLNVAAASNRLASWRQGDDTTTRITMDFDANGNLQALCPGQTLVWNSRNQLDSVVLVKRENGSDDIERYTYDSSGQRVRKIKTTHTATISHTGEARYLPGLEIRTRHNERLEVITLQAGRCSVRYLHWTKGRPSRIAANQLRYSLDDHLGSSSLELDDKADLISQESYLPYGGTAWVASRSAVEADYRTIRYSGKERDASGLYYYGHRYYAPWLQRWISPDPAWAVDGLNLYCMVGNNPLRYTDQYGYNREEPSIKEEIAAYPAILSEVTQRVGTLNYQIYNSTRKRDIAKRAFQGYVYGTFRSLISLGAAVLAAPAGGYASMAAKFSTSKAADSIADKFDATRHLPLSLYPQASRLSPQKIERDGRTAFYEVNKKKNNIQEDMHPSTAAGRRKLGIMAAGYVATKKLGLPRAVVDGIGTTFEALHLLEGIPSQKINQLNNALLELDDHLEHDSTVINEAFDTLGVEEFYPKGAKGYLSKKLDRIASQAGITGTSTLRRSDIQRDIHIARETIQHGRELLFRLKEHNTSLGRW